MNILYFLILVRDKLKKRKIYKIARSLGVESVNLNGNSIEEVFLESKKNNKQNKKKSKAIFN